MERLEYRVGSRCGYKSSIFSGSDRVVENLNICKANTDGGVFWEFEIDWINLSHNSLPVAQIKIFDDAFEAFIDIPGFFRELAEISAAAPIGTESPQVDFVTRLLGDHGFVDTT